MDEPRSSDARRHDFSARHPDQPKGHTDICMCDTCGDLKMRRSAGIEPAPAAVPRRSIDSLRGFDAHWRDVQHAVCRVADATEALAAFGETLRTQEALRDLPPVVREAATSVLTALEVWRLDLVGATTQRLCEVFDSTSDSLAAKPEARSPAPEGETGPPA